MYSESDIETAIATGALTPQAAAALRDSVAASRSTSLVDEESFRLLTGFNDIFVSIATILLLVAVGWIGSDLGAILAPPPSQLFGDDPASHMALRHAIGARALCGGIAVVAASWGLAEFFTRRRRMALPSILLLATFVLGVGEVIVALGQFAIADSGSRTAALVASAAGLAGALAAYLHWRRFHVPITIAALTGALLATAISLLLAAVPGARDALLWLTLAAGLAVFAFAMWWDMSDRTRTTRRSDVAFWLHLAAAPMIAHPIFWLLGVMDGEANAARGLAVIMLYILFGLVALAVDRRALLVSSLIYVLYALAGLFRQFGAVSLNMALTALVIGSALLMLSAFWHPIRRQVVARLAPGLRARLPEIDRPPLVTPRPA